VTVSPLKDAQERIVGASKIARDITQRQQSQERLHGQMARLALLNRITQAIGERQDTHSIFNVVVRTLEEQFSLQLCCICLYEATDDVLTVTSIVVTAPASGLDLAEHTRVSIDQNGLSRCVRGEVVYEPELGEVQFPLSRRLAQAGLGSMVAAPLRVANSVFGALIAARAPQRSFTSSDCEFLAQLSSHVALVAHQAQLHGALQKAYDDLRQTQQAVMQQERLRSLGQMASGIAHDINNAISRIVLYAESLLERDSSLSADARHYLEIIRRSIVDVAQTVSRMREFYRQREPEMRLLPVDVNHMVQQVIDLTRARWSDMAHRRGVVIKVQADLAPTSRESWVLKARFARH
jgi:signal transduction histidine kinase